MDVLVRKVRRGDGPALARIALENAAYYVDLAPDDFRLVEEEGLGDFLEPDARVSSESALSLVAEIGGEVVGSLEAELVPPLESARYQLVPELGHKRLFINHVGTSQSHWRKGVATKLVEAAEAWGRSHGATIALRYVPGESRLASLLGGANGLFPALRRLRKPLAG